MDFSKLRRGELVAAVGGVVLAISVFLIAFTVSDNPNAQIAGEHADASIWKALTIIRYLLLLAALAPIILVWIIARGHQLSWPRGEMTAVIGLTATTLLIYRGIIDRPGEPSSEIGLAIGWFLALAASIAMAAGGAIRASESERRRKPPGVI
jgi:hypothetical protein